MASTVNRVARLGACIFAHWMIIYFRQFLENTDVAHIFVATFLYGLGYASILTKMGWATFWASFSQNHLVTLLVSYKTVEEMS
jgi:hypothetical protein